MKKITLFLIVLITTVGYAQTLPLDFETPTVWTDFNGGVVTTIVNPQSNTDNNSANVAQMVKNAGEVWGGSHTTLSGNMDFANNNTFSMKVYSIKAGTKVLLKVENSANSAIKHEEEVTMSMTNAWETLVFDYSAINTANSYDRIVIIFDNGTMGDGSANFTFYFDDITLYNVAPTCASGHTGAAGNTATYELVWADEFTDAGAPCSANWGYDLGAGGWGNGEVQEYTNSSNNVVVEGGSLKIKAKKSGGNYTSARLKSQGKFSFKYGKAEVRAKLPGAQGTWPAIWMLGSNFPTVGWPQCGEIDIMEQTGQNKNEVLGTLHWDNGGSNASYGQTTAIANADTQFHTYTLEWGPDEVRIYLDGTQYYTLTNNSSLPFNANFFLILNIAMGGTLGGTIDPAFTEDTMEVDYVRVYQKMENTSPTEPTVAAPTPTENAADVISIFSDAYTNISGVTLNPSWGQSTTTTEVSIAGNNTLKYANLNYQGTDFAGNTQDVSGMTHVHFDYWTANSSALKFYLINATTAAAGEKFYDLVAEGGITTNSWVSLNIPLTHFTNQGFSLLDVMQFKFDGNGTVFIDNMYFVNNASLSTSEFSISKFKVQSNPTKDHWTIKTNNQDILTIAVFDLLGKQVRTLQPNTKEVQIDAANLKAGLYIAKIKTINGIGSVKLIKE
jgi:beta-glucanase (GH16 family)